MNFEEINSQSFSELFIDDEEFGSDENPTNTSSHQSHRKMQKSKSWRKLGRPLLNKASSLKNVMMGMSSSADVAPLLTDSSSDGTTEADELHTGAVYVRAQQVGGLFGNHTAASKGSWDDDARSQPLSSNNENTSDAVKQNQANRDCEATRSRNRTCSAAREESSRKLAESLSTFAQNMNSSKSSLNRMGPLRSVSSRTLVVHPLLSANQLMVRSSSERNVMGETTRAKSQGRGRPKLVKQRSCRRTCRRRSIAGTCTAPTDTPHNLEMGLTPKLYASCSQPDVGALDGETHRRTSRSRSRAKGTAAHRTRSSDFRTRRFHRSNSSGELYSSIYTSPRSCNKEKRCKDYVVDCHVSEGKNNSLVAGQQYLCA